MINFAGVSRFCFDSAKLIIKFVPYKMLPWSESLTFK